MSSTTLSSSSASKFQFIFHNALQDYTKQTGVDLTAYDFANQLERCGSPDEVLMVLRDKAKKFKEYRDGNRKLINWITPVVQFVHVFAGFLGEAASIVSRNAFKPFKRLF
jgi:fungal STAND N-terminal Goodbye domain